MTACPNKDRFLDIALGAPAPVDLAEHLLVCTACSEALAELRLRAERVDQGLRRLVHGVEPPLHFRTRLFASIESQRASWARWLAPVGLTAAIVAVAVLGAVLALSVKKQRGPVRFSKDVPAPSLAQWRSPTGVLLRSSAYDLLRSTPRLGEFYFLTPFKDLTAASGKWRNP